MVKIRAARLMNALFALPSPRRRSVACSLLAFLTRGVFLCTSDGALPHRNPVSSGSTAGAHSVPSQQPPSSLLLQQDVHDNHMRRQRSRRAADLTAIFGGANTSGAAVHRRRRHHVAIHGKRERGGGGGAGGAAASSAGETGRAVPEAIEITGADLVQGASSSPKLDGIYVRDWDINGAPHFKRRSQRGSRSPQVHLFFTGTEWLLHLDVDGRYDEDERLAVSGVAELDPLKTTRKWAVRVGQAWIRRPHMRLAETMADAEADEVDERTKDIDSGSRDKVVDGERSRHARDVLAAAAPRPPSTRAGTASAAQSAPAPVKSRPAAPARAAGAATAASDVAYNRRLLPLYLVFVLDAIGLGVALPVLPFFVMGLEATALQLAIVVSSNYVAQTFGCVITGNLSDIVGRKPVIIGCLLGTVISNIVVARSTTLVGVALGRIIGGVTGGLTPIAQAAVADVVPVQSLPKFLGRIQACVGLGFVLGPVTMTILHRLMNVSNGNTFYAAALFPLAGLLYAILRVKETKKWDSPTFTPQAAASVREEPAVAPPVPNPGDGDPQAKHGAYADSQWRSHVEERRADGEAGRPATFDARAQEEAEGAVGGVLDGGRRMGTRERAVAEAAEAVGKAVAAAPDGERSDRAPHEAIPRAVMLLVGNGFLLMYAFSIETIYAMFLKDNFGYAESVLSMVFALNGLAVGALQLLGMRHLVRLLGKHVMLIVGNVFLAAGMVGVALSRNPVVHFALFTMHIMGYSLADTALVALISRYSSPATQGRSLGLNQAAQSMARVVSPVVAGLLYEWSKRRESLPLGALPYLVGSAFPLLGVAAPFWLYLRSVEAKRRSGVYTRDVASAQSYQKIASSPPPASYSHATDSL